MTNREKDIMNTILTYVYEDMIIGKDKDYIVDYLNDYINYLKGRISKDVIDTLEDVREEILDLILLGELL